METNEAVTAIKAEYEERLKKVEEERRFEVGQHKGWLESARKSIRDLKEQVDRQEATIVALQAIEERLEDDLRDAQDRIASLCNDLDREEQKHKELEAEQKHLLVTMELLLQKINK
jgi:predicted RNase H-like nuclease (RuvC/YqgF family)